MNKFNEAIELFPKKFTTKPILTPDLIERLLLGKDIEDAEFDQIFPPFYQFQSPIHWSSISVARQISSWIKPLNRKSIVDIGCGVGKLCLLLRILTDYKIFGIEQRAKLVGVASKIVEANDFKNISIVQMNMLELNWNLHDIYYLYNPFQEHITDEGLCIIENDLEFDKKKLRALHIRGFQTTLMG